MTADYSDTLNNAVIS